MFKTPTPPLQIKQTSDYNQFKYLPANRTILKFKVQQLITSIEKKPYLVALRPVLVNERMEVVDGQHRLQACQALELPVYYIVSKGLTLQDAQVLNTVQTPWKFRDYAISYSALGNRHYLLFNEFVSKYNLSPSSMLPYLTGSGAARLHRDFQLGKFEIPNAKLSEQRLDMLSDFADITPHWNSAPFSRAFFSVLKIDNYDHNRMLKGYKELGARTQTTRFEYLRDLESGYNFGRSVNIVRFI